MISRRALLAAPLLAAPALAQAKPRVVVIGGGFGGATAARAIRRALPGAEVTLIAGGARFVSCPGGNEVIAGLKDAATQVFTYAAMAAEGIAVIPARAEGFDPATRRVRVGGAEVAYDRLVLAPGIVPVFGAIRGYDQAAAKPFPHGWTEGDVEPLRAQLAAFPKGGLAVLAVPATPYRCPPAPYERASLIAHSLKTRGLGGKVLILDSKDSFSQAAQFRAAWAALYPGMIEWIGVSDGGGLAEVDPAAGTLSTDFDSYTPDFANVIPPQRAAPIAAPAMDRTGWCPVDPVRFASAIVPDVHVIGDAAYAGQMSKSAYAAQSQAHRVAAHIAAELGGGPLAATELASICTSLAAPDWGITIGNTYRVQDGTLAEVALPVTSKPDATAADRRAAAQGAHDWFSAATREAWG